MKKKLLTLMTCIAMTLFIACNMKFCKSETSDSEETKKEQPNSFVWYADDLCEYEGFFDLTKITKQQIQNAYSLCYSEWHTFDNNLPSIHYLEGVKKINKNTLKDLENTYLNRKKKLSNFKVPENKFWETLRQGRLRETEQYYKFIKMKYEVFFNNKSSLKEFDKNDECLTLYSDAIIQGGDSLLSAWEHLTKLSAAKNASPERIWSIYHERRNSEDKFLYAEMDIVSYGWNNCAVKYLDWFDDSKAMEEFKKLFTSIKEISCDEP